MPSDLQGLRKGFHVLMRVSEGRTMLEKLNLCDTLDMQSCRHVGNELLQDMIDGHFKFYKQVNDDPQFAKTFLDWLFERYLSKSKEQ